MENEAAKTKGNFVLKLYVTGETPNSLRAIRNLQEIVQGLAEGYEVKVIDILKHPQLVEEEKIIATPTLAKELPLPLRRIIGDLSDKERVLVGLDLLTR